MTSAPLNPALFPSRAWLSAIRQSHAGCACVDIDFALMGRKAVDFLYEKGHRTVVFLRNNGIPTTTAIAGYVVIFRESLLAHAKELGMTVIESGLTAKPDSYFDAQHFVSAVSARTPTARPPSSTRRTQSVLKARC